MKDDRLRVDLDDPYALSIGRALFVFARLEWDAVWCCEKLDRGYINKLQRKTAGKIARDLLDRVSRRPTMWDERKDLCLEFKQMVHLRNRIVHAKPGSTPDGEQRLFTEGRAWSVDDVDDAADQFSACQLRMSDFLHQRLMSLT